MYLYFSIIIIIILIFIIYFNQKKELYSEWNLDDTKNKPSIPIPLPDLSHENITQYNFKRLFKNIELVNKEKILLNNKNNYNFYTQSTTDDKLRMDLDIISKYVILLLNNDNYYDFNKTNFGDVKVWIDKDGNEEYEYELFLWDKKNYFELKLLINIIKFIKETEINKYNIKEKKYLFPDFKDQIIPSPIDVIITSHIDTDLSSIKPNIPTQIKYLYINQIEVQNSTLIVDYHKDKYPFNKLNVDEQGFSGITDMSLEYIKLKGGISNPYLENGRQYNKWPTLDEEPKWKGQYPSKAPPKHWDADGIYYYGKKDKCEIAFVKNDEKPYTNKKYCDIYEPGTRWSEQSEPTQPNYWPTLATLPRNCGENYWLFDMTNGANGTFFGGGKK